MRFARLQLSFVLSASFLIPSSAQETPPPTAQPPQRDPQALAVLSQVVSSSGGLSTLSAIRDFTASGTITHFWAGEEVKGSATLRGRGADQIRMDSNLPSGPRSWAAKRGTVSLRSKGKEIGAPYQNGVDSGAMNYPFSTIMAAVNDLQTSISAIEKVTVNDREVLLIRTQKNLGTHEDPDGLLSRRTAKEVLIDPSTGLPIAVRSKVYPPKRFSGEFVQEIQFGDFRTVSGVLVPFVLTELISGQKTWTFHADSVALNTGLGESDLGR